MAVKMQSPPTSPLLSPRTFGVDLNVLMTRPTQKIVPTVLKRIVVQLQKRGLSCDGLFRKVPAPEEVVAAKALIDGEPDDSEFEKLDPHMLAALFKAFLKDLPDPLLTGRLYPEFIQAEHNFSHLKRLVQTELPQVNRQVLEVLLLFLSLLAANVSSTRVTQQELAIIFAPLIVRPAVETIETLTENNQRINVFLMMLQNADQLFSKGITKRSIIKRHESPELFQQKQKLSQIKATVKDAITSLSVQLVEMAAQLETVTTLEEVVAVTQALKSIKGSLAQYQESAAKQREAHHISEDTTCTTLVESGHTSLQGRRATMEDETVIMDDMNEHFHILRHHINRSLYCVFDGHAGSEVSKLAAELLPIAVASDVGFQEGRIIDALRGGILRTDQAILEKALAPPGFLSGSTAVVCCVVGETLYAANLGDSEAIIGKRKPDFMTNPHPYEPVIASFKHKPSDEAEKERITQAGAAVFKGRIFGRLAVSRALGDCEFKVPKAKANYVSNEPFTAAYPLDDTHDFMVLACDGLWDKLTHQDVCDIVAENRKQGLSAEAISEILCNTSLSRNSADNISAIVVFFQWRAISN